MKCEGWRLALRGMDKCDDKCVGKTRAGEQRSVPGELQL